MTTQKLTAAKHLALAAAALTLGAGAAHAGSKTVVAPPPTVAPAKPFVTGSLSFNVDTHFISYGADVWGAGSDWNDPLFHPSLVLNFALADKLTLTLGTWWDVNDNAVSSIGKNVQEVDVWAGLTYDFGPVTASLTYQEWMFAEDSERIVDLNIGLNNVPFKPYLLLHGRVDGNGGQKTGVVAVIGAAAEAKAGPVTFSFPVAVAFMTDKYQGGDAGFGYASIGANVSVPIVEHLSFNAGVTAYHTDDKVIPNNPEADFITGTAGFTLSF